MLVPRQVIFYIVQIGLAYFAALDKKDDPDAERIMLVVDNLNTRGPGSLDGAFAPEEVHRLAARFEWRDPPEHGSWLNSAECEYARS